MHQTYRSGKEWNPAVGHKRTHQYMKRFLARRIIEQSPGIQLVCGITKLVYQANHSLTGRWYRGGGEEELA